MNLVKPLVSGNSDAISLANRQDNKDSSSKREGSGFSDTLGSLGKAGSSKQTSSASATNAPPARQGQGQGQTQTPAASNAASTDANSQNVTDAPTVATVVAPETPDAPAPAAFDLAGLLAGINDGLGAKAPEVDVKKVGLVPDADEANANPITDALTDLAALVTALSKTGTATAPTEADGLENTAEDSAGDDAPPETGSEDVDLLSLLAPPVAPTNPMVAAQNAPSTGQTANALGGVSANALGGEPTAGDGTASSASIVRLQKQDAPAIDLHIDANEDGTVKVDVATASGNVTDVVQVVDSRRYIGLAATSNAAALTTAMTTDPDWASSMSGQTAGSPMIASTGQVVHTLKLQMSPVDLGHVTAALKLVGDELSVHLTAHTLKAYSELQKDSSSILDALKAQGFNVEQVTVNIASDAERQDSNPGNRQAADLGQQSAQQGSQRGNDDKSQGQFSRQVGAGVSEEAISYDSTIQPATPARGSSSARPDHVYL
ncbi:flagellar hook-length control protein FliK [Agrobacterium sp. rho-13.3]|uniref:flagellar hook-length control protein FliK n=1 Tax=Agrobacterium sp. rho-13.3 TaxID=3072980 RepID=UPI002A172E72|nr:flagellar hook-length control protein FliK [Agrobacterium sp. rho-13.3]MDX8310491.1 flagellar hook-length control protein FliK [Agrobacterium sp. rho-13.3]